MSRGFLFICSLLAMTVACNNQSETKSTGEVEISITDLRKDVIIRHDTAMAKMNHMAKLQKKLQQEMSPEDSILFMNTYVELQAARDAMMNWMREFNVPQDSSEAVQIRYLKGEYDRISEVDESMRTAIAKAEKLLTEKALN